MISAGTIGGGQVVPAPVAAPAAASVATTQAPPALDLGGGVALNIETPQIKQGKETTDSLFSAMREQIHGNIGVQNKQLKYGIWKDVLNGITNLGSQAFAWATSVRFFKMQEHIADNAQEVQDRRSDNEVIMQGRAFDAAERLQPQAMRLEKEVAQIHEDAETQRYDHRLASREREMSLRNLDSAFSMRSDYPNYGNPFARG